MGIAIQDTSENNRTFPDVPEVRAYFVKTSSVKPSYVKFSISISVEKCKGIRFLNVLGNLSSKLPKALIKKL
jgi:hypothetical protein